MLNNALLSRASGRAARRSLMASAALALTLGGMAAPAFAQDLPVEVPQGNNALFSSRVLTTGLSNPWGMQMGPDGKLWVTERSSAEVTRIDPYTGEQEVLLQIEGVSVDVQHQGLLGLLLHPELGQGTGNDYVYLVYTYDNGTADAPDIWQRLVRYTYDENAVQLVEPEILLDKVPAWNDHNGGRLMFSADHQQIFYTLGEQGANFGGNFRRPNRAQQLPTQAEIDAGDFTAYSGKILRVNLDGSIPEDNPEIDGVRSHIYTYGHRNPQGIAQGPDGTIYASEHGPDSDDELNLIVAGGNYGWPIVAGYQDDTAYVYADWSQAPEGQRYTGRTGIPDTVPQILESELEGEMVAPLATYFTVDETYDFTANCGWICNPTVAPSSLAYYSAGENGIAEWDNALLIPTLKHGTLYVQHLSADGQTAEGLPEAWFSTQNRYRDVLVTDDNVVFIATDGFGTSSEKFGTTGFTNVLHNPGAILMFTYNNGEEGAGGITFAPAAGAAEATEEGAEAATEDAAPAEDSAAADLDMDAMMTAGQTLFARNCSSCHGAQGQGAQGPSFVGNEDALSDETYLAGMIVNGFGYMPSFARRLDDQKIAEVATFIRNSWGNEYGVVDPAVVASVR